MPRLVICYDIVDDAERARLAKFLKGYGERVQKSVFEGDVTDFRISGHRNGIKKIIDEEDDSVRIYHLCRRCEPATEIIGTGRYIETDEDTLVF